MRPLRPIIALTLLLVCSSTARPQAAAPAKSAAPTSGWPLERVTLNSGKIYQGLVEAERPASIEFVEVHRPRGKPPYLVLRPIDRKQIANWERLSAAERGLLAERIDKIKNRAFVESRHMEDLSLAGVRKDGTLYWQYAGEWFSLESTADQQTTRLAAVRLEQILTAYRQLLPPRVDKPKSVQILLFGENEQYRTQLARLGIRINNPALFAPNLNLVAAGSEINRARVELAKIRKQHQDDLAAVEAELADFPKRRKQLSEQLAKAGFPDKQRNEILTAEQKKWEQKRTDLERKIKAQDRKNQARFNELAGQMFSRLNHETFHAYLENYVYPQDRFNVPRWLNEGLAQTFEAGVLEAETLRIDAPNRRALAQLQSELDGLTPLPLAELLTADSSTFLLGHGSDPAASAQLYLYSWGLAYYLAFEQPVLGTTAFHEYISLESADVPAIERFEKLVGMSLADFEERWRKAIRQLKG